MSKISDERREVAARLRTDVSEEECIDYAVFRIIKDVLWVNGAWGAKAARILADLIDPTCHDTLPDWGPFECSECGTQFSVIPVYIGPDGTSEHDEEKPRFCPNCGARLVGE